MHLLQEIPCLAEAPSRVGRVWLEMLVQVQNLFSVGFGDSYGECGYSQLPAKSQVGDALRLENSNHSHVLLRSLRSGGRNCRKSTFGSRCGCPVSRHLELFCLAHTEEAVIPKHHFLMHMGDFVRRHPLLLNCFVHERRHKDIQRSKRESVCACGSGPRAFVSGSLKLIEW